MGTAPSPALWSARASITPARGCCPFTRASQKASIPTAGPPRPSRLSPIADDPSLLPARSWGSAPSNEVPVASCWLATGLRKKNPRLHAAEAPQKLPWLPPELPRAASLPEPGEGGDKRAVLISVAEPRVCQPKQELTTFQKGSKPPFFSTGDKLINGHRYTAVG